MKDFILYKLLYQHYLCMPFGSEFSCDMYIASHNHCCSAAHRTQAGKCALWNMWKEDIVT